jgi:serine protease Do
MKKILMIALVSIVVFGAKLNLEFANDNFKRENPSNKNIVLSYNSCIKDAKHSVVNIATKKKIKVAMNNPFGSIFNDPFFRQFFGQGFQNQIPKERFERSLGSGVIISKDGYIVTNAHVVKGADSITVTLGDNPDIEYNAQLIGIDVDSDLAVIKIKAKNLQPIKLGDSNKLKVGDIVFAIGNPFGVGQTVTKGIVSALNKSNVGINRYENFIQTDAPINPGNSGGALIDSRGVLIGINSAILTRSGGNNGIGFAIPVNMVKEVATKLVEQGKVVRGYLGVSIGNLDKNLKKVYNHKHGAVVLNVAQDTPAKKYGLKRGDLIYKINNQKIKDATQLSRVIGSYSPNDKITLYVERNKQNITLEVVLADRTSFITANVTNEVLGGLILSNITDQIKQQYHLPIDIKGAIVTKVKQNSKAANMGFMPGDVIIQIEDIEIKNLKDANKALAKYKNRYKRVYVSRGDVILVIVVK